MFTSWAHRNISNSMQSAGASNLKRPAICCIIFTCKVLVDPAANSDILECNYEVWRWHWETGHRIQATSSTYGHPAAMGIEDVRMDVADLFDVLDFLRWCWKS